MKQTEKYYEGLPDLSDDAIEKERIAKLNRPPTYSEETLKSEKDASFAQGQQKGIEETRAQQAEQLNHALQQMIQQLTQLSSQEQARTEQFIADSVRLSLNVLHKVFPTLLAEHNMEEMRQLLEETALSQTSETAFTVFIHPDHGDDIKQHTEDIKQKISKSIAFTIKEDSSVPLTDCRIEWSHGGAERNTQPLIESLTETLLRSINHMPDLSSGDSETDIDENATADETTTETQTENGDAQEGVLS